MGQRFGRKARFLAPVGILTSLLGLMLFTQNFGVATHQAELDSIRAWDFPLYDSLVSAERRMEQYRRERPNCAVQKLDAVNESLISRNALLKNAVIHSHLYMLPPPAVHSLLKSAEVKLTELRSVEAATARLNYFVLDITDPGPAPTTPSQIPLDIKVVLSGSAMGLPAPGAEPKMAEMGLLVVDNTAYPRAPIRIIVERDPQAYFPVHVRNAIIRSRNFVDIVGRVPIQVARLSAVDQPFPINNSSSARLLLEKTMQMRPSVSGLAPCEPVKFWAYVTGAKPGGTYTIRPPETPHIPPEKSCVVDLSGTRVTSSQASLAACRKYAELFAGNIRPSDLQIPSGQSDWTVMYAGTMQAPFELLSCSVNTAAGVATSQQMAAPMQLECLNRAAPLAASNPAATSVTFGTARLLAKGVCTLVDQKGVIVKQAAAATQADCHMIFDAYMRPVPPALPPSVPQGYFGFLRFR